MLWVCADRYGVALPERRATFKAISFSRFVSDDGQRGAVVLRPEERILQVGGGKDDYHCVRIFDDDGTVIGTMYRSPSGQVIWRASVSR